MTGCRPHARLISITCPWRNGAELAGPVLSIGNAMGFDGLKCGMRYSSRAVSEDQAIEAAKQARPRNDRSELPRARTLGVPRGDRDPAAALGHFGDKAAKSSNRGTFPSCSCFHNLVRFRFCSAPNRTRRNPARNPGPTQRVPFRCSGHPISRTSERSNAKSTFPMLGAPHFPNTDNCRFHPPLDCVSLSSSHHVAALPIPKMALGRNTPWCPTWSRGQYYHRSPADWPFQTIPRGPRPFAPVSPDTAHHLGGAFPLDVCRLAGPPPPITCGWSACRSTDALDNSSGPRSATSKAGGAAGKG